MNIVVAPNPQKPKTNSLDGYDSVEISGRNASNAGQSYASIQLQTPKVSQELIVPVNPDAGVFGPGLKNALNDLLGV